jgi:pilus assembly protein Flp/PilA
MKFDTAASTEPRRNSKQAAERKGETMDLVAYWQQHCAPYIKARFGRDERGASLVEYALLVALIAVVCLVAIAFLGHSASQRFSTVGSAVGNT